MRRPLSAWSAVRAADYSRRHFLGLAAPALALGARLALPRAAAAESERVARRAIAPPAIEDWDVPGGHFYTQGVVDRPFRDAGFVVADDEVGRLWSAYRQLGGPAQLGFPVSARYDESGLAYQVLQAGVLRWQSEVGSADLFPVYVALADLGLDEWLETRGIPRTSSHLLEESELPVETRLTWLTQPTLRAAFLAPDVESGLSRFGAPMGEPERFGPYLAQRFEKAVLQLWLDDLPDQPSAGTVSVVQVGDLLAETGLVPEEALAPQRPPAQPPAIKPATMPAPLLQTEIASPLTPPARGNLIVVSLSRQWWFAFEDGRRIFDGPVTTGQPALATPAGSFSVLSRHSPYTMYSPWGPGSPFWYAPSSMTYALRITNNGVFLHDAPWRPYYGSGTNVPHLDPDGVWRTGSHGCINLPYSAAAWLWTFAPVGTPVEVVG